MPIFAIVAANNSHLLKQAIAVQYGANHYEFADNVWFVSDTGSTRDISEKLGIFDGKVGASGVVLRFNGYAGRANSAAWAWLQQFPEAASNG